MAKGKAKSPAAKATDAKSAPTPQKALDLKNEGNKMFAQRDYAKAIEQYDEAMKILPDGSSERADLLCNKAACYYAMNKLKEAVKECGSALEVSPGSIKALRHRSKALEKQGMYKAALGDIQAINKTESATDDTREAERRLKDLVAGRRPSLANGGARAAGPAGSTPRGSRSPLQWPFSAKVTLGNETRLVQLTAQAGYADLMTQVKAKFPNAGPFALKYVDKDGDLVTITCRSDVQTALAEALKNIDRRLGVIPPIKVTAVQVKEQSEVPQIPFDELQETAQMMLQQQQQLQAAAAAQQQAAAQAKQTAQTSSGEVIEIDDWLIEFANLFREMSGIDADRGEKRRHVEPHNEGWNLTTKAMDATLSSDKAQPLFDKAIDKFKEVIASGYLNWGNVFLCKGHKHMDVVALAGGEIDAGLSAKVSAEFDAAEAKIKQALDVKEDMVEALSTMAGLEFDRAKLAAGYLVKPPAPAPEGLVEGSKEAEEAHKAAQEAANAATREALAKIKADGVEAAKKHMDAAHALYKKAHEAAVKLEAQRKAEQESKQKEAGAEAAAEPSSQQQQQDGTPLDQMGLAAHTQVLYGNSLYEWSQVLGAVGQEWRPLLDDAAARFKDAGCAEKDIRNALKNHTQADQLDLGPDPEPEPAPAAAQPAQQQAQQHKPAPEAKGLPKLERKPKEKAAAQ